MYTIEDNKGLFHKWHMDQLIEGYAGNFTDREEVVIPHMSSERLD